MEFLTWLAHPVVALGKAESVSLTAEPQVLPDNGTLSYLDRKRYRAVLFQHFPAPAGMTVTHSRIRELGILVPNRQGEEDSLEKQEEQHGVVALKLGRQGSQQL